jgi:hypothetical protein
VSRSTIWRATAIACAVTTTLVAAAPAHAQSSFTIRTSGGLVSAIGAFHPSRSPTLAAAMRVFGSPSSRKLTRSGGCEVDWRRLRLRIDFENFGGHAPGLTTCSPSVGRAQSFTARGSRFRTVAGLRAGARSDSIQDRHPSAEFRDGKWWLVIAVSPFGDESEYVVLQATVGGGRVRSLGGPIGGAGE